MSDASSHEQTSTHRPARDRASTAVALAAAIGYGLLALLVVTGFAPLTTFDEIVVDALNRALESAGFVVGAARVVTWLGDPWPMWVAFVGTGSHGWRRRRSPRGRGSRRADVTGRTSCAARRGRSAARGGVARPRSRERCAVSPSRDQAAHGGT